MELKVWVDGVVRVVCGLSLNTPCQDVVIALAQAIGQTGRYILISKLRGTERALVADDCPLLHVAQLGQLGTEVQFILRRTGPSLSSGSETPTRERRLHLHKPSEPEPLKHREPHKALSFNLGPSTFPRRNKPKRNWSPSPRASPEPQASPAIFLDSLHALKAGPSSSSKEEVFRQVLQQKRRLQDLEIQLQALERDTDVWEQDKSSVTIPSMNVVPEREMEELEERLRQNQTELMHLDHWEEEIQAEMARERDMYRRLHQIQSSVDDQNYQIKELQARSAHLEKDVQLRAHRQSSQVIMLQPDEVVRPLKQELHHRLQQEGELDATLSETHRDLQAAEERVQDRWEMMEELNKELRQCKLQQFIQQSGSQHTDHTNIYLSNASIME